MKIWITVLCAVVAIAGCAKKDAEVEVIDPDVIDFDQLEERDGLWYFKEKPFTGVAVKKYDNGQKWIEITYKDGKEHGLWTGWHENGQKKMEGTYRDNKLHGLVTGWYEHGPKSGEYTFKDGEVISEKEWDEDGNLLE